MDNLRDEFDRAVREAIRESYSIGYPPIRFEQMIESSHPVEVAKRLITSGEIQDGFRSIVRLGRSDITVESIMLRDGFKDLFTAEQLDAARWRLENVDNA